MRMIQTHTLPRRRRVEFRIETAKPEDFTVHLRIPGWAGRLTENPREWESLERRRERGRHLSPYGANGGDDDTIELELPLTVRRQAIDDRNRDIVAAMKGSADDGGMLNPRDGYVSGNNARR